MAIKQILVNRLQALRDEQVRERKAIVDKLQILRDQKTAVQNSIDALTATRDAIDVDIATIDSTITEIKAKAIT